LTNLDPLRHSLLNLVLAALPIVHKTGAGSLPFTHHDSFVASIPRSRLFSCHRTPLDTTSFPRFGYYRLSPRTNAPEQNQLSQVCETRARSFPFTPHDSFVASIPRSRLFSCHRTPLDARFFVSAVLACSLVRRIPNTTSSPRSAKNRASSLPFTPHDSFVARIPRSKRFPGHRTPLDTSFPRFSYNYRLFPRANALEETRAAPRSAQNWSQFPPIHFP